MKKGIGSVVAIILITLLTVVSASVFIGYFLRNVGEATNDDSASCFGIDLEVNGCIIIPAPVLNGYFLLPDTGPAVIANVERNPGGGEIKGLRFTVTDSSGNNHIESPVNFELGPFLVDTNYSDFVEYDSDEALLRNLSYTPVSLTVSAVVGRSQTICPATNEPVTCVIYS